jgi:predicted small metal-binding protein
MTKQLRCRDVGMNCDFEMTGKTEEEVLQKAAAHASSTHQITQMTPELTAKVRSAIRTV